MGVDVIDTDGVRIVTIDRPAVRNAIDLTAAVAIDDAMAGLEECDDLHVGILTGAGGVFSAGKDIKAYAAGRPEALIEDRGFAGLTRAVMTKPLIAAVEGYAVGGGFELVLACDLVVASAAARFGLAEVTRGLVASEGGLVRLPRRLPRTVAMELLLTGEMLTPDRAAQLGLINRIAAPGHALAAATELAMRIRANAPLAVRATKQVVRECAGLPEAEAFSHQDRIVRTVFDSRDADEGLQAFLQRRAPLWTGE